MLNVSVNRHSAIRVSRESWAIAIGFLVAFCWLGWAAVRFGSIFDGMDIHRSLPIVNRLALTYGPIAFPLFGVLAAAATILSDFMFHKRWLGWAAGRCSERGRSRTFVCPSRGLLKTPCAALQFPCTETWHLPHQIPPMILTAIPEPF